MTTKSLRRGTHGQWLTRAVGNGTSTIPYWPRVRRRAWWWPEKRIYLGRYHSDPQKLAERLDDLMVRTRADVLASVGLTEADWHGPR